MKLWLFLLDLILGLWLSVNAAHLYATGHDLHGIFDTVLAAFMLYFASVEWRKR